MIAYDVAIIGSGPAGNAAVRASLGRGLKVLWLEEGSIKPDYPSFSSSEIMGKYRNSGQEMILSRPLVPIGEPLAIGGGLDINAGIFQRPLEETYQQWDLSSHPEWSWQKMSQEFDKLEADLQIPLSATSDDVMSSLMKRGAENLVWKYKNIPVLGLAQRRQYVRSNIDGVLQEGGAFQHSTRLHSLRQESGRWMLKCEHNGEYVQFKAKKVFLAAGTLQTPKILFRSGLGSRISSQFGYHPMVKIIAEFAQELATEHIALSSIQVKEFSPEITLGASVSSKSTLLTELVKAGVTDPRIMQKFRSQMMFYCTTSKSPKTYLYNSKWTSEPLAFSFHKQMSAELRLATIKLTEFCFSMGAKKLYLGKSVFSNPSDIEKYLCRNTPPVTAVHLFSSLPMGPNEDSTVDCLGQLRKAKNIYVIDGSVMPGSPAVNPQELIMSMAQKITSMALQKG